MSVSLFVNTPAPPTAAAQCTVMHDILAMAELADLLGFERFYVTEHHSVSLGATPDPLQMLAAVAARTSRIGLGTAAIILGLSNPLRVAESVTQLDALSGGRASLGLARGFDKREFAAFGVTLPDADDFFRGVAEVRQLLCSDLLRPRATGSVPLSVAASSGDSYERAAVEGLHVLTNPYFIDRQEYAAQVKRYRTAATASGTTPHVMAHVIAIVAPTDSGAARVAAPVIDEYLRVRSDGRFSFAELHRDRRVAVGSPATVSQLLAEYADIGVDEVAVNPLVGIADRDLVRQTVELLASACPPASSVPTIASVRPHVRLVRRANGDGRIAPLPAAHEPAAIMQSLSDLAIAGEAHRSFPCPPSAGQPFPDGRVGAVPMRTGSEEG